MDLLPLLPALARALKAAAPSQGVEALCGALAAVGLARERLGETSAAAREAVESLFELAEQRAAAHDELLHARERSEMLSSASFEGIMIHVDGHLIDANQRLLEMVGMELTEVLAPDFLRRVVVPEDLIAIRERLRDRLEGDYTVTAVRKDGSLFRAEILSKQGKLGERPVRVAAVRDVSERERILGLVRESEHQLRDLAKTAFDVLTYSRRGVIVDLVGDVEAFFGTPRDQLIGRSIVDVTAPEARDVVRMQIEAPRAGVYRSTLLNDRGERIPVEIVAVTTTLDGIPTRLTGLRDLREAERIDAERRRLEQHMQQSQRLDSLGVLAGGIAHDFNNLLVGILGGAELLAQSPLSDEDRESLQAITDAGQRAATLTTQLLAYAGRRDLGQREPVELRALLLELRRLLGNGPSKRAVLELAIEPDAIVLGNRATVLQVVMNLLTNASDALNGAPGTIFVSARRIARPPAQFKHALGASVADNGTPWILIEVRDTGTGMDEATRARIFEPFFSTKAKGHGLGLAACLGIVSSHGGAILVESVPGKGSTFSVLMPAADGAPEPSQVQNGDIARTLRVLVVDDEPVVRRQVRRMLQSHGYSVLEAADGSAALAALDEEAPALMLLDVTMPGLDGTEVVREARRRGHAVPILLFSGYADFPLEQRLEQSAYDGFLAKPFSLESLLTSIAKALGASNK